MSTMRTPVVKADGTPIGSCLQLVPGGAAAILRGQAGGRRGPDSITMRVFKGDRSAVIGLRLLGGQPAYIAEPAQAELLVGFKPDD